MRFPDGCFGNLTHAYPAWHSQVMASAPKPFPERRTPRVKLAGSVTALVLPEDREQVRGRLHQLSFNGGLLQLAEPLETELNAELIFRLGSTTVRTHVGTMPPMWATEGCLQPFRFTGMTEDDRQRIQANLEVLLESTRGTINEASIINAAETVAQALPDVGLTVLQGGAGSARMPEEATEQPSGIEIAPPILTFRDVCEEESSREQEIAGQIRLPHAVANGNQVVLYFDRPEDALRFTIAASSVLSCDLCACPTTELARLFREFGKVSRLRTATSAQ